MIFFEKLEKRLIEWSITKSTKDRYYIESDDQVEAYDVSIDNGYIVISSKYPLDEDEDVLSDAEDFVCTIAEEASKLSMNTFIVLKNTEIVKAVGKKAKKLYPMFEKMKDNTIFHSGDFWYYSSIDYHNDGIPSVYLVEIDIENEVIHLKHEGANMFEIKNHFEAENLYYLFTKEKDKLRKAKEELAKFTQILQEAKEVGDGYTFSLFKKTYQLTIKKVSKFGTPMFQIEIHPRHISIEKKKPKELFVDVFGISIEEALKAAQEKVEAYFTKERMKNMLKDAIDE